jgi:hypothetical protein
MIVQPSIPSTEHEARATGRRVFLLLVLCADASLILFLGSLIS